MELALLIGIQGSGKSSFARERLFHTHVRLSRDLLGTPQRETVLLHACIAVGQPVVVDNTNPLRRSRRRYIGLAKSAGFWVVGYYFPADVEACVRRNVARTGKACIPEKGIRGTAAKLEPPALDEGYDVLHFVTLTADGFEVRDEV